MILGCKPGKPDGIALVGADSLGLLAPGKVADLVVLSKDPLADIKTRAVRSS